MTTRKNIYVQYLTLTFISRPNLGQIPLKVTKQAHSDLRTLYVLVFTGAFTTTAGPTATGVWTG
jgi:hypothetical protein